MQKEKHGAQNQKLNQSKTFHVSVYGRDEGISKRYELSGDDPQLLTVALKEAVKHPPKIRFQQIELSTNPFPDVTFGDHDIDMLKIDFDEMPLPQVKYILKMLYLRYDLDGYIILQSSTKTHRIKDQELEKTIFKHQTKSYHAVFNRPLTMIEINRILAWLCLRLRNENLTKWFFMQLQKGTYTLRIGFKGKKKPPRIIYCYGNQDKQIAKFLSNRNFILSFLNQESKEGLSRIDG